MTDLMKAEQRSGERQRRKLYGRRKWPKLSERQLGLRRTLLGDLAFIPGTNPFQAFANSVQVTSPSREALEGEGAVAGSRAGEGRRGKKTKRPGRKAPGSFSNLSETPS